MPDKNLFGGGNAQSLYTPMSEDEQEVLQRLVQARDLDVKIMGWGVVEAPQATFGDLRVAIPISITFNRPEVPILVSEFHLELWCRSLGILLFKETQDARYGGQPIAIGSGTRLTMIWDIAVQRMDPKIVKMIKPGATGLTSRWTDKDTGDMTLLGNTRLSARERKALRMLRIGEAQVRSRGKKTGA